MGVFDKFKEWIKSFKKEKVIIEIDAGVPKDHPDYEAHIYLKQKFGYNKRTRRSIIHKFKKRGGEF